MKTKGTLSIRVLESNPNHHLWNNNGGWWIHYTEFPTPIEKQRVRRNLATKDVRVARAMRDLIFRELSEMTAARS